MGNWKALTDTAERLFAQHREDLLRIMQDDRPDGEAPDYGDLRANALRERYDDDHAAWMYELHHEASRDAEHDEEWEAWKAGITK